MFICPQCSKSFGSNRGLTTHKRFCRVKFAPEQGKGVSQPEKSCCKSDLSTSQKSSASSRSWNSILMTMLVIVLGANIVVMFYFTMTVSSKLNEAIEITKPQEGVLTLITASDCSECGGLDAIKSRITAQNIELTEETALASDGPDGQKLITLHEIQKLPAYVFETKKKMKAPIQKAFQEFGRSDGENAFVFEQNQPPYFDVALGVVAGVVDITYLTDAGCEACYDVEAVQKAILQRFGLVFGNERSVDISEDDGADLIEKYAITQVPTMILSKDAALYDELDKVWIQVGTVESDGMYVFRQLDVLGVPYFDLNEGEMILQKVNS